MQYKCSMCGIKFDPEFTAQCCCKSCEMLEDKVNEHFRDVELEEEIHNQSIIETFESKIKSLEARTAQEDNEAPKKDLKGATAYQYILELIKINEAFEHGVSFTAIQGQAMDGYAALAHFTDLAKRAKKEITNG